MDDINDFFDFSKPFKRVAISGGYVNGRVVEDKSLFEKLPDKERIGKDYADKFQQAESKNLLHAFAEGPSNRSYVSVEDVDDLESEDNMENRCIKSAELMTSVFQKYNFKSSEHVKYLPVINKKHDALKWIEENPVLIIQGATGCGKTTQIPQYILENAYTKQEYCNIIVTQPRRIAAISVAKRVAYERDCNVGSLIGYKVGLNAETSEDTRLTFVTTGVLLQSLVTTKTMTNYTHVILDEVHEREVDMDFLLIVVRKLLSTNSKNVKIILMSATINTTEFSEYFKIPNKTGCLTAPVLKIGDEKLYEVNEFYFDDLEKLRVDFEVDYNNPGISDKMFKLAAKIALVCDLVIIDGDDEEGVDCMPSIIMFLPGINEIDRMAETLIHYKHHFKNELDIIKLHSSISSEEQAKVFRYQSGHRKIILSTNIAESSITVKDIKFVIDFCLTRVLHTDTITNFSSLKTVWASRSNCIQRAGRAGRVMNGRVYRLVDKRFYFQQMDETCPPEILRCPLENVVLKAKLLNMGPPPSILGLAMTPPDLTDIRNTILNLKTLGALLKTSNKKYDCEDGDITTIGRIMAQLPLELRLSKLIILGHLFGITDLAITLAAGMNVKSVFLRTNTVKGFHQKLEFANRSASDGIATCNAFKTWESYNREYDRKFAEAWTRRMMLEHKNLAEMAELKREIKQRLTSIGIKEPQGANRVSWTKQEESFIMKIIIGGAFLPNFFFPITANGTDSTERDAITTIGGRDPNNTVFFTGFEHEKFIGPLYKKAIKKILTDSIDEKPENMKISFEKGSNKVFVTFLDKRLTGQYQKQIIPGKVHLGVYNAVKLRKCKLIHELHVMQQKDAIDFIKSNNLGTFDYSNGWCPRKILVLRPELSVIPAAYETKLVGTVTHIEHLEKFFVRPTVNGEEDQFFINIEKQLNGKMENLESLGLNERLKIGDTVIAYNKITARYARGRIESFTYSENQANVSYKIFFMDYGSMHEIPVTDIYKFSNNLSNLTQIPPRVVECALCEIKSVPVHSPEGIWIEEIIKKFKRDVLNKSVSLEVYSVVDNVARVLLHLRGADRAEHINRFYINKKLAMESDECFRSKMDHDMRERKKYLNITDREMSDYQNYVECEDDIEIPNELCKIRINLKGPYSPLEITSTTFTRSALYSSVIIENESVNSILLDTDPQDLHEKLIVAGSVSTSQQKIIIRQTTMMPNIPGLPALLGLIFAPTAKIILDEEKTRVVAILYGLGCNEITGESLLPEHDMMFPINVEITEKDIMMVNVLRSAMEEFLYTDPDGNKPGIKTEDQDGLFLKIKDQVLRLFDSERKYIGNCHVRSDYSWRSDDRTEACKKMRPDFNIYDSPIFPLYSNLGLLPVKSEKTEMLRKHVKELYKIVKANVTIPKCGVCCKLCEIDMENILQLRLHLYSKLHRDKEYKIKYY